MDALKSYVDDKTVELLTALEEGLIEVKGEFLPKYQLLQAEFDKEIAKFQQEPPFPALETPVEVSQLNKEQNEALKAPFLNRLSIMTGGPGTGKTFTAAVCVKALKEKASGRFDVAIAAPTGKAVQRLQESLKRAGLNDLKSSTLHRLLKINPFFNEEPEILPYDFILVDESSMIDLKLMVRLLKSIKKGARLLLIGDPFQLPPVEAGRPFHELCRKYPVNPLKTCLRAELKELIELHELIKAKKGEQLIDFLKKGHGSIKWEPNLIPYAYPLLTPLRKGPYGVEAFNRKIFKTRNDTSVPIMITSNDPELELYNGDIGSLQLELGRDLTLRIGDISLFFNKKIPALLLPKFELGYALSIHKSQGSEFDEIHLFLPEGSEKFGVSALYTAATRAKRKINLYANETTLLNFMRDT